MIDPDELADDFVTRLYPPCFTCCAPMEEADKHETHEPTLVDFSGRHAWWVVARDGELCDVESELDPGEMSYTVSGRNTAAVFAVREYLNATLEP